MRDETTIVATEFQLEYFKTKPPEVAGKEQAARDDHGFFRFPSVFSLVIDEAKIQFTYVGAGAFNLVYSGIIGSNKVALRIRWPIFPGLENEYPHKAESRKRMLRIWNELYSGIFSFQAQEATLKLTYTEYANGENLTAYDENCVWSILLMPFIEGTAPEPQEIKSAMLEDFERTGRVPPDGCAPGNYKKMSDGRVICVDPIFSLRRAPHEILSEDRAVLRREASGISNEYWNAMKYAYNAANFWMHPAYVMTKKIIIVLTTKALLLLQDIQLSSRDFLALKTTAREDNNDVFAFLGKIYSADPKTEPGFIRDQYDHEKKVTPFALLHFQKMREILDVIGLLRKDINVSQASKRDVFVLFSGISRIQDICGDDIAHLNYLCEKARAGTLTQDTVNALLGRPKATVLLSPDSLFGGRAQAASTAPARVEGQTLNRRPGA